VATLVRTIEQSELSDWLTCKDVGFLATRRDPERYLEYVAPEIDPERTWGAFDDSSGRVVGTLRSFPTTLTVPGPSEIEVAALTNVTVAPTHRRRGLLSQMITGDLTACALRGEAMSILIASEYPIYGRFGYGHAADSAAYTVDTRSVRFRHPGTGWVELVDLPTARKIAPELYESFRASQPGSIGRDDRWWDRTFDQVEVPGEEPFRGYCAVYRAPSGEVEGYVRYRADSNWEGMRPRGTITVDELLSVSDRAYQRLWQFCCEVDLVATVNAHDRSIAEQLPWLLVDGRSVRQTHRFDFLWVRILDVCAALSRRHYLSPGRIVIEVTDPLGFAAGTYAVEVDGDGQKCTRTSDEAELTLPVEVLGSIYLGGPRLGLAAAGRMVEESRPGAMRRAESMFGSDLEPWCNTWF
jgi:predicted acetyltransferase